MTVQLVGDRQGLSLLSMRRQQVKVYRLAPKLCKNLVCHAGMYVGHQGSMRVYLSSWALVEEGRSVIPLRRGRKHFGRMHRCVRTFFWGRMKPIRVISSAYLVMFRLKLKREHAGTAPGGHNAR